MHPLKRQLKWWANALFFRAYRYRRIERRHLLPHYTPDSPLSSTSQPSLILMYDGRRKHGGLADRLRAAIYFYTLAVAHGRRFRINFTFPFQLETYLVPNTYDWRLRPGELTYNPRQARPFYTDTIAITGPRETRWQLDYALSILNQPVQQLHVYSPFVCSDADFSRCFHQLFRPSPLLEEALGPHRRDLGSHYISVSTRFMELLGDFREPKTEHHLTPEQQLQLIARCREKLIEIHSTLHPDTKILLTSDSQRFLDACRDLPWVYIVDGQIAHTDTPETSDHLKTFLDFWLITEATEVYQLQTSLMYAGNFSLRAALASSRPHHLITF